MTPVVPPFSFAQAAPPPPLTDVVDALWVARGTITYARERIMPTTSPVLIINLGSPFRVRASRRDDGDGLRTDGWIVGPQTGYVENIPLDRIVDLDLLWGPGGQIINYLKSEHGMTHGYANLVAMQALHQPATEDELVAAQYSGKEQLRPIYEAALAMAMGLGADVEPAPKKTYVSLRRNKQFALLKPATKTRLEVGLNLPGETATDRLTATTGMCTHIVTIASVDEVDEEVRGWLTAAYERA